MFWNLPDADAGAAFLDPWIEEARSLVNRHFTKLAAMLDSHRSGFLACFRHRSSTGPPEGLNNTIRGTDRAAPKARGRSPSPGCGIHPHLTLSTNNNSFKQGEHEKSRLIFSIVQYILNTQ